MYLKKLHPMMSFPEAAEFYLQQRTVDAMPGALTARYIKQTTEESYRQQIKTLSRFFTEVLALEKIHIGTLKAYQKARLRGDLPFHNRKHKNAPLLPSPVKAAQINQELTLLRIIMRRAGAWTDELHLLHEDLLEEETEVPRALTEEEQRRWIEVSKLRPKWEVVLWYSLVAFDTTMSTNELRGLRIGDVNLHQQVVKVPWPASKNKYRHRTIALESAECVWAFDQLLRRAYDLGSRDPLQYLFPFRDTRANEYVPGRPITKSGLKKPWDAVREASGLTWFRMYDTRHTAITRLAESGVPIEIIKSKAGHINDRMSRHYTHISLAVQRRWMQFANEIRRPPSGEYDPKYQPLASHPMFKTGAGRW